MRRSVLGKDINNACAKLRGLILKNGGDNWTLVRKKCRRKVLPRNDVVAV